MTLQDILGMIDTLPNEELDQLEQHILNKKRQNQYQHAPQVLDDAWALAKIQDILKDVPPTPIQYGTMDGDKFLAIMEEIHDDLSDQDRAEIIHAMTLEYVPEDNT